MVGQTLSHYRIVAKLGEAGMGEVHETEDLRLGRHVALKLLPGPLSGDVPAIERLRREAPAASSLDHPHICTVCDIDEEAGRPFIAMEALEGQTLRTALGSGRSALGLPIDERLRIACQLADALEAAHTQGIIDPWACPNRKALCPCWSAPGVWRRSSREPPAAGFVIRSDGDPLVSSSTLGRDTCRRSSWMPTGRRSRRET